MWAASLFASKDTTMSAVGPYCDKQVCLSASLVFTTMNEERAKPKQGDPFAKQPTPKQIPPNASVPGIQPKNTPDGRDAPARGEQR